MNRNNQNKFDVFLCHNSQDKDFVRKIYKHLESQGVKPWLDEFHLPVGIPWYEYIFSNIGNFDSVAIFVGSSGVGTTQEQEIERILRTFKKDGKTVIPVLLPSYEISSINSEYLREQLINKYNYSDFRIGNEIGFKRLLAGIRHLSPSDIKLDDKTDLNDLPEIDKAKDYRKWFCLYWAGLHWLGFVIVNTLRNKIPEPLSSIGIIICTLLILILLILAGLKQINYYKIGNDNIGSLIGITSGIIFGFSFVLLSGNFGDVRRGDISAFAGLGSVIATGYLTGRTVGPVLSIFSSLISGFGVFIAASLTPYFELDKLPVLLSHSLGAVIWGGSLALYINLIYKNYLAIRRIL